MNKNIRIFQKHVVSKMSEIDYETFTFNGGEEHVRLITFPMSIKTSVKIVASLISSKDIMRLLLLTDALRRNCGTEEIELVIGYAPYSRQDRVCNWGESLSVKVFTDLINSQRYSKVTVYDPHSYVSTGLLDRCEIITQKQIIDEELFGLNDPMFDGLRLRTINIISPDAGSNKKCFDLSKSFGGVPVVRADKIRNVATGEIEATEVYREDFNGEDAVIIDDICDGGRTFVELAKVLHTRNVGALYLYVTHGIFSKGLYELKQYFEQIYTTDSLPQVEDEALTVLKVSDLW